MLICPCCEFENADLQLSCEACGQSFQRWRVIDIPAPGTLPLALGDLHENNYIDINRRYRLTDFSLTSDEDAVLKVIDCQPKLDSPLQALQQAWLDTPNIDVATHPLAAGVPSSAYPYLALQADYFPAIPELHNAWQTPERTILLIEDRTTWPTLTSAWAALDGPLQHIQWLFETTLLWHALAPWQGHATLLNLQRLTLNATNLICLTQLDQVDTPFPLPLQTLGQVWQMLLGTRQGCLPPSVQELVAALALGGEMDLSRVQDTLVEAAKDYQDSVPETLTTDWVNAGDWVDDADAIPEPREATNPIDTFEDSDSLDSESLNPDLVFDTQDCEEEGNGPMELPTMVLPMKLAQVDDCGQSHVGQQRRHNEDWFFTQTQLQKIGGPQGFLLRSKGLYILCDGMGGHASGEVASQLAVRTLRDYLTQHWGGDRLPNHETLTQAVITANQTIFDINQSNATSGVGRMGTTLVMVLVHNLNMVVVHVGDSRLYSYSKRLGLRQLTLDHEVGQREINRGIEPALAYARPDAYQLTQALGPRGKEDMVPSIAYSEITEDTLLLLCSDGLSDNNLLERHADTHIASLLSSRANLDNGVAQLIDLANEKNGHDNITAILVRIKLQPDLASLVG